MVFSGEWSLVTTNKTIQPSGNSVMMPIWIILIAAIGMNVFYRFGSSGAETFAASSDIKRILLPQLYVATALVILFKRRPTGSDLYPLPASMQWLAGIVFASTCATLFFPRQPVNI